MKIHSVQMVDGLVCASVVGKISRDQWPSDQDVLIQFTSPDVYSRKILLNLENVEHIDSTGVEWLLKCHARCQAQGGQLILHSISPMASELFRLMRMDLVLTMAKDQTAAINQANPNASSESP